MRESAERIAEVLVDAVIDDKDKQKRNEADDDSSFASSTTEESEKLQSLRKVKSMDARFTKIGDGDKKTKAWRKRKIILVASQ